MEMRKKNIYRLCNVQRLEQDIKSRCHPRFFYVEVFYYKSDMHVRPMWFNILCTPIGSYDKIQLMYSAILLCLFVSKYDINGSRLNYSTVSSNYFKYI